jgi:hypothetical protein
VHVAAARGRGEGLDDFDEGEALWARESSGGS